MLYVSEASHWNFPFSKRADVSKIAICLTLLDILLTSAPLLYKNFPKA